MRTGPAPAPRAGQRCQHLVVDDAWLVDPASGRSGRGRVAVEEGRITALTWTSRRPTDGEAGGHGVLVLPGLVDLHAHLREPGPGDAETIETGLLAAAAGGFTTVCAMADTTPPVDTAAAVADVLARGRAGRSPVRLLTHATATAGRAGERLAPLAELAEAGAIAFSDDAAPIDDPGLFRQALAYAGGLGRPLVEHPGVLRMDHGAEAHEGLAATILGLRGSSAAAEAAAVGRALAVLAEVSHQAPPGAAPHLHLAHVSTAAALALVRAARSDGLAVTCDVTPHHLALYDGWLGGDRRFAWEALTAPWAGGAAAVAPYDTATRVDPPLRSPEDAVALWAGLAEGTVDAIATDHAPRAAVARRVEFGDAAPGMAGLETALGLVLAGVGAGLADLDHVVAALTTGPVRALDLAARGVPLPSLAVGAVADLVVVDRDAAWVVDGAAFRSLDRRTPLQGVRLPGRVRATVAGGRWAYRAP